VKREKNHWQFVCYEDLRNVYSISNYTAEKYFCLFLNACEINCFCPNRVGWTRKWQHSVLCYYPPFVLVLYTPWRLIGGVKLWLHAFITLALDDGKWATSLPGLSIPVKQPRCQLNRRLGGFVGGKGSRDVLEKGKIFDYTGIWTLDYPSSSLVTIQFVIYRVIFFFHGATAPVGQGLLIIEALRSHSDTPHSVGLLWTSDQPDTGTFTWQYKTLTRGRLPWARRDSTPKSHKRTALDPRVRPRDHWDRFPVSCTNLYQQLIQ
jgi:hypothetical protein